MNKHDYEDALEYITENVKLVDIIEGYGFRPHKESEGRYTMVCPFHNEDTASLKIYKNDDGKQSFFCFGCGAGYSAIDFIKMHEDIGFMDVINRYRSKVTTGSGENIYQKLLNHQNSDNFDLPSYMLSSKFRLGIILREKLKLNPNKEETVDKFFSDMDVFFEEPGNMNKESIDYFEETILEGIKNEL